MNLFNFMDGIDGIVGVETLALGFGIFIFSNSSSLGLLGLVLAGTVGGFLVLNWAPAKIFLGDVGSFPIGFLSGWLLLSLAVDGDWIVAIILHLYFLIDCGCTLIIRLARLKLTVT